MNIDEARTRARAALTPLAAPILNRGEQIPDNGPHVILDMITETPVNTLERSPVGVYDLLQITAWSALQSTSNALTDTALSLLEPLGFYRVRTTFLIEEKWHGTATDFEFYL